MSTVWGKRFWQMTLALQASFAKSVRHGDQSGAAISFKWTDINILMDSATSSKLAGLILASVEASQGKTELSCCTDKAVVDGLPVQNSFLAYPDDCAVPCAPQDFIIVP